MHQIASCYRCPRAERPGHLPWRGKSEKPVLGAAQLGGKAACSQDRDNDN